MAAFRGMHVSPAKHSYASVTDGQTDRRTDRQTTDKVIPMCRYASQATQKSWKVCGRFLQFRQKCIPSCVQIPCKQIHFVTSPCNILEEEALVWCTSTKSQMWIKGLQWNRTGWDYSHHYYRLVDLFPPSKENPTMPSKNNPDTSGYCNMNFILCLLIALLITQSVHREYSSINNIHDIYSSIMSCCWFEARFWHKMGKCFTIYVRKHWNYNVKITWNYLRCVALRKVKVFDDAQGLVQL